MKTYDDKTGTVTFTSALRFYHFGAAKSTGEIYNGVDIRGEVLLLSRNIKIMGTSEDDWGCQIITGDATEFDSKDKEIKRGGQMFMVNVEMERCSQKDNNAAIRFESVKTKPSIIKGSAFHGGLHWGMHIRKSDYIVLEDNIWFGFRPIGVNIDYGNFIRFSNNFVGMIVRRDKSSFKAHTTRDKEGAVIAC